MTDTTTHCRPDFLPWEKRATCIKCAAPLADNPLVREAHKMNVVNAWAKQQLSILADMAEDRGIDWFAGEARRVADGLLLLDDCPDTEMPLAGWQPIESAPRDGTAIQAVIPGYGADNIIVWQGGFVDSDDNECCCWVFAEDQEPPECWTDGACWAVNEDGEPSVQPTHWKPLEAERSE